MLKEILQIKKEEVNEVFNFKPSYKFEKIDSSYEVNLNIDNEIIKILFIKIDLIYDISFFRNDSTELLNLNKSTFKILSAVKNIIFDFIDKYNPKIITFTTSDKDIKRFRIYSKLCDNIRNNKNYNQTSLNTLYDLHKDETIFILYKNIDLNKIKKDYFI